MTTKIDQKEYLKKYLSGDKKKKKKKDKSSKTGKNVKIVDDDVDVSKFHQLGEDEDPYQLGEDAPQIVGVIDDRPPELRVKEDFTNNSKWKLLEDVEKSPIRKRDSSPWGKKENRSDYSPPRRNNKTPDISPKRRSPDLSPPRQRKRSPDLSPPRQKRRSHDLSPPRQKRRSPYISPRRQKNRAIDQSPPRQKRRSREMSPPRKRITSDQSPSRKRRSPYRSPSRHKGKPRDLTPPRQRKSSDISPPPRQRRNRTPELSPVRVKKERDNRSSDLSPARRRQNRTPDISPQRYRKAKSPDFHSQRKGNRAFDHPQKRNRTPDLPPGRIKPERISRSPDLSPRGARQNRSPDLSHHSRKDRSPKRKERSNRSPKRRKSRDLSPRQRSVDVSASDRPTTGIKIERISRTPELSPQIIQRNGSPIPIKQERSADTSQPIRKKRTPEKRSRWDKREDSRDRSPQRSKSTEKTEKMTKTLDGKAAGLQDAKALRIENDKFKKRENEVFDKMSTEMSGRYAETVVREKSGKRKDIEKEIREEMEKKKKHEQRKEVYTRWNKGVKQTEEYKKKLDEAAHEMDKPMARYSNDVDLENHFKKQDRVGDTMLGYMRTKKKEKDRKAGVPERPLYKGMFPNNRYNIRPGYRWDGVDRSSGYEKKWFEMQSNKKAVAEEAYKYSVEDM